MAEIPNQPCGCSDCEAAVSPAAYLTALLDYTLKHIRKNGKDKIDLKFLVDTFHQPFTDLPTDCGAVEEQVRQVRICIEVLRSYLGSRPLVDAAKETSLAKAEEDYGFAVYSMLLRQIGTSYEEIRRIRTDTAENRKSLADRLGIDLTVPRPANLPNDEENNGDELDQLFMESGVQPPKDHLLTTQAIEKFWGLADTTRDPLSAGTKIGDAKGQITRWNLKGLVWGQNTDHNGRVYIALVNPAATIFRVQIYQDIHHVNLVASGEIATATGTLKLNPENNSHLSGVFEIAYTVDSNAISIAAIPAYLSWKYKHLRTIWTQQDHPTDPYSDDVLPHLPIIDPDLIGPDDFRTPTAKVNPADPNKAFDIWLKRRAFLDSTLAKLKTDREANGLIWILQHGLGNPLPDLDGLLLVLTKGGTSHEVGIARDSITAIGLSVESFTRLMAIRAKNQLAESDARNEKVSTAEWNEMYSILAQAIKVKLFEVWRIEEQAAQITLGRKDFWFSVTTPQEGDWPPVRLPNQPLVDPGLLKLTDLPEWLTGKQAIAFWNARKALIDQFPGKLQIMRETNGFTAMLELALGNPASGNPLQHDLDNLIINLNSLDEGVRGTATIQIETDLHLSIENFKRLMVIKSANDQADPAKKPTAAQWAEVFAMLMPAHKIMHLYPQWVQEENTTGLIYWKALKARLPLWRASLEDRLVWQQALRVRSQPPLIHPTVVQAGDLQRVTPGDAAFDIWKARYNQVITWHDAMKSTREAAPNALGGLDKIIQDTFEIEPADLESLDLERLVGHSVEKRLDQLNLTSGSFTYLLKLRNLAKAAQPITSSEWDIIYNTLVQVKVYLEFSAFRAEEQLKHIILAPDFFKIQTNPLTPLLLPDPATPLWLSNWQTRRDWQDGLQSRLDQQNSLTEALRSTVGAVEEATLSALRDALIIASNAVGANLQEQAEWITTRLLIDARAGGCQNTTRVALALETLQTLIFDLRSGQFKQLVPFSLSLVSDYFDQEWQWIGSYASFRAATFVFIYPENILQPSLLKYKTPVFADLVKNTRTLRLDPANACNQAEIYAAYFRDVCSLNIQATCQASTVVYTGEGCDRKSSNSPAMFYMFAKARSGKLYWSAYSTTGNSSGYAQSFWKEIEIFGDIGSGRIIGAMPYQKILGDKIGMKSIRGYTVQSSYIHLFCLTGEAGKQTLQLARLNLDDFGIWDPTLSKLSLPDGLPLDSKLDIVPVQTQSLIYRPSLVFHYYYHTDVNGIISNYFYYRNLNHDGTDWDQSTSEWWHYLNYVITNIPDSLVQIKAVLHVNGVDWFVVRDYYGYSSTISCKIVGGGKIITEFDRRDLPSDIFIGALPGPEVEGFKAALLEYNSDIYVFSKDKKGGTPNYSHETNPMMINLAKHQALDDLITIPPNSGSGPVGQKMLVYQREKNASSFYMYKYTEDNDKLIGAETIRAVPRVGNPLNIPLHLSATELQARRQEIISAFALNSDATPSSLSYLREAYYFVPLHLALALQSAGHYLASLDCFRTFYDYEAQIGPPNQRNIFYGLELDAKLPAAFLYQQADGWLLDPLNPHLIAATRHYAYTRFTLMSLVRCMLDFADSEFTQETGESLARARTLYLTALDLLKLPELQQKLGGCDDLIAELKIQPGKDIPPEVPAAVGSLREDLTTWGPSFIKFTEVVESVNASLKGEGSWNEKIIAARAVVQQAIVQAPSPPVLSELVNTRTSVLQEKSALLLTQPALDQKVQEISKNAAKRIFQDIDLNYLGGGQAPKIPPPPPLPPVIIYPSLKFCIPPNPLLKALRLHTELNLFKLRTCRNIAGLKRQLEVYAAPTDTTTGLPSIGAGGQLILPGVATLHPTLYRYPVLIERAKQLVNLANQAEAAMLSVLEMRDALAQTLLETRQGLNLAQAGVRLQDLIITEARGSVTLSTLQQSRSQFQVDHFTELLETPISDLEQDALYMLGDAADYQVEAAGNSYIAFTILTAIALTEATGAAASTIFSPSTALQILGSSASHASGAASSISSRNSSLAAAASTRASIIATRASYERRAQDWAYQQNLSKKDVDISVQQVQIANDHVEVTKQERLIAGIHVTNSLDTIEFLTNKFTNLELYDWMSNILEGVYSFFLQQATTLAKLAETQLAFERQEVPPAFIKSDYWKIPSDSNALGISNANSSDRRGLTGSARLLQDIYQLDQYAFDTNKRKLQLSKTISLAQLAPAEFQRFRQTGVMLFATPLEMFDRGFPGHYLRLIKRVRTSVIALIPPVQGIYATLSTSGPSRVVIGGDLFQTVAIHREPEFVALSSPINSTGVFELDSHPDMLLPFEGSGVEMIWEFSMPKAANQIEYRAIADVLITLEYTALSSFDYRQQVIQSLKPTISAERPFSFRSQFADQWYDLHNSEQTSEPMVVTFTTLREDFPPNIEALKIQQVLLYFVRSTGTPIEVVVNYLRYTAQEEAGTVGGGATSIDGIISTRRGNAGSWTTMIGKSPIGKWELALPNTEEMRNRFGNEDFDDILFVITYSGRTPEWPI